jgi:phosphatidylglycerophosphatase A
MHYLEQMKNFVIKALATGFGFGLAPFAPGTFGTLVAIPIFWFLQMKGPITYMLMTLLFTIFACAIAELAGPLLGETDSPNIVIDEIVGFLITMTWLPRTWQALLSGFILFRILDIIKPGPIRYVEKKIKGGIGVVADDVLAGIIANILLQFVYNR